MRHQQPLGRARPIRKSKKQSPSCIKALLQVTIANTTYDVTLVSVPSVISQLTRLFNVQTNEAEL